MQILEGVFDEIDIENIRLLENIGNDNNTYFTDGRHTYHFSVSKNTLFMIFDFLELLDVFDVNIVEDPYTLLMNTLHSPENIQPTTQLQQSKAKICLRLYSFSKNHGKFVGAKSGLNQWNASGRPRNPNELYIPYPKEDRERLPDFFPPRDTPFNLRLPDGTVIPAKVCQQDSKAIMSNPNKLLGKWLLRDVFELPERTIVTYDMLEKSYLESIETLRYTVEAKDTYTRGHSDRVSEFAVLIGKKVGLSEEDLKTLKIGGLFHDIGKIGVPDNILQKEAKLTDDEYSEIKNHPSIGAHILSTATIFKDIIPIVKHHHERYDGNGYPGRLKGEEIPIAAQVVALVDVYDALISERCYKKAYSHGEALKMILEGQCGAFNPTLLLCLQEIAETLESELMDTSSEQETKSIQDIRNEIDYGRLFSYEKHTVLSHKQEQLRLLYIDSLTSIYNRRYYDEHFQGADDIQAMVVIDVDNFKHINDNYGHDVGDIVLQSIAQTVLSCVRKTDVVIRYGGDEFVIIFFSIPQEIFEKKLERIRHSVDSLIIDGHPELHMSVSIGGAYGSGTAKKLFKVADNMMYQSKKAKNQVTISFLDEMVGSADSI